MKAVKCNRKEDMDTLEKHGALFRDELEYKYQAFFEERLNYGKLVTYVPNKREPVYNWFKYKEGFSKALIERIFDVWEVSQRELVFDPFAGCGTTLLAAKDFGYEAVGIDILPVAVFVTKVKIEDSYDLVEIDAAIKKLGKEKYTEPRSSFPNVAIINKAFPESVQKELLFYKEKILEYPAPVKNFLLLGLLSILEEVSYTSKDGQFLRLVQKRIPPVRETLLCQLQKMYFDLLQGDGQLFRREKGKATILLGDARQLSLPKRYDGKVGIVMTSPPYLNRYDYSRTYALELCTLFVEDFDGLRRIRHSLLRSHIESKEPEQKLLRIPALTEILSNLEGKELNNDRIPIMIRGYFEDMNLVLKGLYEVLKPGGLVALVVANARFEGEMVPVDLLLSEIAESYGFRTEKIWVTRYKGNSSQQMGKYGRVPVRESIVFWRKDE